jgi:tetratricopeptide (TPR) repeat protein
LVGALRERSRIFDAGQGGRSGYAGGYVAGHIENRLRARSEGSNLATGEKPLGIRTLTRRMVQLACVAVIGLILVGCAATPRAAEKGKPPPAPDFAAGRPQITGDVRDLDEARAQLEVDPDDLEKVWDYGAALYQAQRWKEAEEALTRARGSGHDVEIKALYHLGHALIAQHRLEEAIEIFEDLTRFALDDAPRAEVFLELGYLHEELGRYEQALEAFRESLRHVPEQPHLVFAAATLEAELGDFSAARKTMATAIDQAPDDRFRAAGYAMLGRLDMETGDLETARMQFQTALEFDPSHEPALQGLRKLGRR